MFEALKAAWDSMTPEQRKRKVDGLNSFTYYRSFCEARGYIKVDPIKLKIVVYKKMPEVELLFKALKSADFGGFKVSYIKNKKEK